MTPLDLSTRPPRSPRVELGGLVMLARVIDRARASLPGGNLGLYDPVGTGGLGNAMLDALSISPGDFIAAVAQAETDDDVVAWVEARTDIATRTAVGARLSRMRLADVPADRLAYIKAHYPPHIFERSETGFDLLDDDDRESFGKTVPHQR
ncbi:MAG: hypothetical protein NVS3B7_02120 [Candidatus Elarobacter sp.]